MQFHWTDLLFVAANALGGLLDALESTNQYEVRREDPMILQRLWRWLLGPTRARWVLVKGAESRVRLTVVDPTPQDLAEAWRLVDGWVHDLGWVLVEAPKR